MLYMVLWIKPQGSAPLRQALHELSYISQSPFNVSARYKDTRLCLSLRHIPKYPEHVGCGVGPLWPLWVCLSPVL